MLSCFDALWQAINPKTSTKGSECISCHTCDRIETVSSFSKQLEQYLYGWVFKLRCLNSFQKYQWVDQYFIILFCTFMIGHDRWSSQGTTSSTSFWKSLLSILNWSMQPLFHAVSNKHKYPIGEEMPMSSWHVWSLNGLTTCTMQSTQNLQVCHLCHHHYC